MSEKDNTFEYDEEDSVEFIQSNMPNKLKGQLTDDEINYLVDLIYEYYEDKGYLNDDADDNVEIDEEELIIYVLENAKKDKIKAFTQEQVEAVIEGELSYYDSLDDESFDESFDEDFEDDDFEDNYLEDDEFEDEDDDLEDFEDDDEDFEDDDLKKDE